MSWINSRKILFASLLIIIFINEFSLAWLDSNPPLSSSVTYAIRLFNFLILSFGLFHKYIVSVLNAAISYIMPVLITVIALDFGLSFLGFGYPKNYNQENILHFPNPSDTFRGKPNTLDHNQFGFRGEFADRKGSYNVAIFGGSTTYNGNPPIIELMANELEDQDISIDTFNFGSSGSNHSQHVRRLLEFSDRYKFDLVIFYGGGNETIQYASSQYDPRPGYPFNFFFRNELEPWKQTILRISSIIGTIDIHTKGLISGLNELRNMEINEKWTDDIVANYWRDLNLANSVSKKIIKPDVCDSVHFLSVLQPGNPSTKLQKDVWNTLLSSQAELITSLEWVHADLSKMQSNLLFTDVIHVNQKSRELISKELAKEVSKILSSRCE